MSINNLTSLEVLRYNTHAVSKNILNWYYNAEEIKQLIDCLDGDPIRMPVLLASYYSLRRSEVLGLK